MFKKFLIFLFKQEIENEAYKLYLKDGITKNTYVNYNTQSLEFNSKELIKILALTFWDLVRDCDNYLVLDLKNQEDPEKSVYVTIVKKGKLTPFEKFKILEEEKKGR